MPTAPSPSPAADRNLLFGILALQMDFISRDALIKGMNAWVLEKSKPLGQLLVEQGALRPDAHALLEPLVHKHLELHGRDAQRSLATVSSLASIQKDLEQIADADVQASLAFLLPTPAPAADPDATKESLADPYATHFTSVGAPTSAGLRFRILRPHAKGGLGQVSVAQDEELHREVALKEIQDRHADHPESRARFVLEAEITGGLEHPGIVPVYGLGHYPDGRPFYAMRFIRGDSLKDAIDRFHKAEQPGHDPGERILGLRQLLGRFVDVCNAIAYAHARGVLHRDLKPGNVMLGQYGETLVVDWGLAKPVGRPEGAPDAGEGTLRPSSASGSAATQMGQALGTPAFMPPEQAAGRLDHLGPASDVYSLGATLYCLLTGKAPFEDRDVGAILRKVQRGDFPPPRQVKRSVPAALEAICLKAMALRPEDRYASPRELADEVEHWLADEPVAAYREPWATRLSRWGRRHKPWVAGSAGLLVTAVIALTVSTILIKRQKTLTEGALNRLADAHGETEEALRRVSEREKQVSQTNTKLEETLARSLLRPLGQQPNLVTDPEIEALWELAGSNDRVRLLFIEQALRSPVTSRQLRLRADLSLHAAVGLDPVRRQRVEKILLAWLRDEKTDARIREDCAFIGLALDEGSTAFARAAARHNIQDMDRKTTWVYAPGLEAATARLNAKEAGEAARLAVDLMVKNDFPGNLAWAVQTLAPKLDAKAAAATTRVVLDVMGETSDFQEMSALQMAVTALAPQMDPKEAGEAARVALAAMGKTTDPTLHCDLAQAAAALVARLDPKEAAQLAGKAAQLVKDGMVETPDSDIHFHRAIALEALAPSLAPRDAGTAVRVALDGMGKTTNGSSLSRLAKAVAALVAKLDSKEASRQAGEAARLLLRAASKLGGGDLYSLSEAVAALAARLEAKEAGEATRVALDALARAAKTYDLKPLAEAVATLAARLGPKESAKLAGEAARVVFRAVGNTADPYDVSWGAKAVATLAPSLGAQEGARQGGQATRVVLGLMRNTTDPLPLANLAEAVTVLAPSLDPKEAGEAARVVLPALGGMTKHLALGNLDADGGNGRRAVINLIEAVAALAPRLDPKEAREAARVVLDAMAKTTDNPGMQSYPLRAVMALASRLDLEEAVKQAGQAARLTMQAMGKLTPGNFIPKEVEKSVALLVKTSPDLIHQRAQLLVTIVGNSNLPSSLLGSPGLLAEVSRPLPFRFSEQQLVELLKLPTCQQPARKVLVEQLGEQSGKHFANVWEFVKWARKHRPDLDLTSPPVRL